MGFALHVVRINGPVLLQIGEQIQLEGHARMAGGHDLVGHKLPGLRAAEVAIQADARADLGIVQRFHSRGDIGGVRSIHSPVAGQPVAGPAMTALATDPVGNLETRAPKSRRSRIGVAAEAFLGVLRRADAHFSRDGL